MEGYTSWKSWTIFHLKIIFLLVISSHWLHHSSAVEQDQDQNQPTSTTPDADQSKPTWPGPWPGPAAWPNPWNFPTGPKPDTKKDHGKVHAKPSECNCNCKCDCPKVECKTESNSGPVVCLPMNCEGNNGCRFGGGMNLESGYPFQFPFFGMPGEGNPNAPSKSAASMNTTAATHP